MSRMPLARDESLALLRWLIEAGADEAVSDAPIDRFAPRNVAPLPSLPLAPAPVSEAGQTSRDGPSPPAEIPPARTLARVAETVSPATAPAAARALAAACNTLAELQAAVSQFDGCDLKRFAKTTVFADGNASARLMLIGEAPGRDEDEQGRPFVGRAGKLLDLMLAAIGLDRSKVYITNVLNWHPPQNRDPTPEEAAACLPFLHRHIELADPVLLILLGGVSCRHVLGISEGIMRLRGRWQSYQSAGLKRAIPVMPTLHPAFLLRQPAAKRLAWRDLLKVSEKLESLGLA